MPSDVPAEPWRSFLQDLTDALDAKIELHCLGGFAISVRYGLPRSTVDIDVLVAFPSRPHARLVALAGRGSSLHAKHRVYLDIVTQPTCPDGYADRVSEVFAGAFPRIRLFILDPYDLALAKLERNFDRDREDVEYLAAKVPLDVRVLRERYEREMRPYLAKPEREDLTLDLWTEMIEERRLMGN